jgi:type II secretory pathway pseudopilin PulG
MTRADDDERSDAGVTLIELIIYVLLLSLVLGGVAMILIISWRTQQNVLSETEATNRGQLVSSSIERAVRNSLDFTSVGNDTLMVWTSFPGERTCQGFSFAGGNVSMRMTSGLLGTGWPQWQDGITAIPGYPFVDDDGKTVTYAFEIQTSGAPVRFTGTVDRRSEKPPSGVTRPCW